MTNDLTSTPGGNNLINTLFKDIDFSKLNATISVFADHCGQLSDWEKESGVQLIREWEANVLDRLEDHGYKMHSLISFFEDGSNGCYYGQGMSFNDILEDIGYDLAVRTNTVFEHQALVSVMDIVNEARRNEPFKPILSENTKYGEHINDTKRYEAEIQRYNIQVQKLEREVYQRELMWRRLLRQHPDIQGMIKKAKAYNRNLDKFTNQCKDKAQFARLNISIRSMEVKQALKDLLNFTIF